MQLPKKGAGEAAGCWGPERGALGAAGVCAGTAERTVEAKAPPSRCLSGVCGHAYRPDITWCQQGRGNICRGQIHLHRVGNRVDLELKQ